MWLSKVFWYLLILLKYFLVGTVLVIIAHLYFPSATLIIGGLFLMGSFGAAYDDYKEKVLPKLELKGLNKRYNKVKDEFDGFDDMLRTIQRNI